MPKWRLKNIIMCSIAFTIALIITLCIGFLNIGDGLKFGLMFGVILLTAASIIYINEKKLKKEEGE